jgi:Flp pilus assembly protein TadD
MLSIGLALLGCGFILSRTRLKMSPRSVPQGAYSIRLWVWVALPLVAVPFWILRDRSHFLGDGQVWISNILAGRHPLYSEPLAAASWYAFASLPKVVGLPLNAGWLSLFPVLAGVAAATLYWVMSGSWANGTGARLLVVLLLMTLGSTQLYCGYIEGYPVVSVAILLYLLLLSKCASGSVPDFAVGAALAVAISSHFVASYLAPSYLLLIAWRRTPVWRIAALIVLPLALVGTVLVLLGYRFPEILDPLRLVAGAAQGGGSLKVHASLLATLRDLLNLCLLLFPVPILVVAARLILRRMEWIRPKLEEKLLLAAALPGLVTAGVLGFLVSPAHDWDLLTITFLPFIVWIAKHATSSLLRTSLPSRAGLVFVAAGALTSFLMVNANETSAISRYASLLAEDLKLTSHERAYGNERLVIAYTRRGEHERALVYAQRALQADSANARYWGNVGSALYNLRRYPEAIHFFEEASRRGLQRSELYYNLAQSLLGAGRPHEAVRAAQRAIDLGGERQPYLFTLGLAQVLSGDTEGARRIWDYVLKRWPEDERTRQAYEYYFGAAVDG